MIRWRSGNNVWSEQDWSRIEEALRHRALGSEQRAWPEIVRGARAVLRRYSTSFFIVTRFLPPEKRDKVEVIYATVRFPDEIVDTFPLTAEEKLARLDAWGEAYERGLRAESCYAALVAGVPPFLAGFTAVVRDHAIPHEHYRAFLAAMKRDAQPRPFASLDDLIENYIYGSAIVVGYFLTHVYGTARGQPLARALCSARALGIALQLTNFARDVAEDARRGRLYIPLDILREHGIDPHEIGSLRASKNLAAAVRRMARVAEDYYRQAEADLDAFAADCRPAIRACIDVYRQLNDRVAAHASDGRQSVPMREKFRALPVSKYWKLPLAYLVR